MTAGERGGDRGGERRTRRLKWRGSTLRWSGKTQESSKRRSIWREERGHSIKGEERRGCALLKITRPPIVEPRWTVCDAEWPIAPLMFLCNITILVCKPRDTCISCFTHTHTRIRARAHTCIRWLTNCKSRAAELNFEFLRSFEVFKHLSLSSPLWPLTYNVCALERWVEGGGGVERQQLRLPASTKSCPDVDSSTVPV